MYILDNSLDKSLVSVLGLQERSTCSVTVTGVAEGAGGSGAKSKKPIGTPRIPPFCNIYIKKDINHMHFTIHRITILSYSNLEM